MKERERERERARGRWFKKELWPFYKLTKLYSHILSMSVIISLFTMF